MWARQGDHTLLVRRKRRRLAPPSEAESVRTAEVEVEMEMPRAVADHAATPAAVDFESIRGGKASVTASWLAASAADALGGDARSLFQAGAFTKGGLGKTQGREDAGSRLCDCCGLFDDAQRHPGAGDQGARQDLFERLAELRESCAEALGRPLAEHMELQYLR